MQAESLLNPTPAMVALMERAEERERERQGMVQVSVFYKSDRYV